MSRDLERDLLASLGEELPRRDFLKLGATTAGALALAACGGSSATPPSGPTGPDFKIGAILPSSGTYSASHTTTRPRSPPAAKRKPSGA